MQAELDAKCVEPLSLAKGIMIPSNIETPYEKNGRYHIYAYVDGETKYVPLRFPGDVLNSAHTKISDKYDEKLCTFAIDDEGYYYIRCLSDSYDDEGNYNGLSTDFSYLYNGVNENRMIVRENETTVANVQRLDGENNEDTIYLGFRNGSMFQSAIPTENTKVIVRTYFTESDTYEWATYDYDALMLMGLANEGTYNIGHNIPTEKLSFILSNKKNTYKQEYLVAAYITNTYVDDCEKDIDVFTKNNCNIRQSEVTFDNGNVTLNATGTDLSIGLSNLNLDTSVYNRMRIRLKYTGEFAENEYFQLFFKRTQDASFEEIRTHRGNFEAHCVPDGDGWYIFDLDLSGASKWNGTIKEIRFDPVNALGTFTFDYIKFINNGKYEKMTDAELEALYTPTSILYDTDFENGFDVRPIVNSYTEEGYFEYTGSGDSENNVWAIGPWWTHDGDGLKPSNYAATSLIHNRADTDEYTIADKKGSKAIIWHPEDKSLTMTLNGSKIYDGTPHIKDDPDTPDVNESNRTWWPHLLIEQDPTICEVDKEVHSADAERMVCELDIRMPEYKPTTNTEGQNACQFLVYFYLFLKDDTKLKQRIWFGACLFDDRGGVMYVPTWNRDSAANQMIYCIPQEMVYGGMDNSFLDVQRVGDKLQITPETTNEWKTLRIDLTPHIDRVVEWANRDNAFGKQITKSDLYFGGVNLGYETHGNIDCTFDIRNFNLISYN